MEPPEMINAGELVLKRWELEWAPEALAAVKESLPELREFLPWATEAYNLDDAVDFITRSREGWADGEEFNYAIFTSVGELAGSIGLMTRRGPGVLEIGYWTRTPYAGRGYMTAAVNALTRVAFTLPGIARVAILHDELNKASAAVAAKAGFTEVGREIREPQAPGESATTIVRERQH
ncbi:GNAT family N-acetyltransferase [Paractinoplanes brasiliensis]|uniref:RimJ/RimL family protein N-acetyltransferase n=1 Tax=Paractinoplanes brasiliensis TaxID=52695 RepID=A0A4R6JB84_9ACTN|nr:GNAT family N-acetyltransferase [Actinoplanes brasiliensis]TDO32517.1 RimJ/RimL family protein N-acetyltransferase [Actinoplanes brasiliensis]